MIRGVHHVAINTSNLERLVAFYRDVVGFELLGGIGGWENDPRFDAITGLKGSAARAAIMRSANIYLELFEYRRPAARNADALLPSDRGYTHICLDVDDARAEHQRLSRNGMTFHGEPVELGGGAIITIYGRDPDGNVLELQQLSAEQKMSLHNLEGCAAAGR